MTPTVTPTATTTLTATITPTATATASPTATLPPTSTPFPTLEPTATPPPVPTVAPSLLLPATQPGASRDEGTFLVTGTDGGGFLVYFIAGNARHSVLPPDMQRELERNPLWPVRSASADEVLSYPEGAPVGSARAGLLNAQTVASDTDAPVAADQAAPVAETATQAHTVSAAPAAPAPVVAAPAPVAAVEPGAAAADQAAPVVAAEPGAASADQAAPVADAASQPQPVAAPAPILADAPVAAPAAADGAASQAQAVATTETPVFDAAPQPVTVTLRPGDNLTHLSAQYGTTIDAILAANGLSNANRIYVGQTLVIPTTDAPGQPAQTADQPVGPVADLPSEADQPVARSYTVQPGDSATSIARQFGVDLDALLATNGVTNRNRVLVGQVLTIPSAS